MKRWFKRQRETQVPPGLRSTATDWRRWDSVGEAYERIGNLDTLPAARDLLDLVGAVPGARVLDVGCGTGAAVAEADVRVSPGGVAAGADIAEGMLVAGKRARPQAGLVAAEAINLPFADGRFDAVVATFVLAFFARLDTALYDMIRVLRAGGRLGVSWWGEGEDELGRTWRDLVEGSVGVEMLRGARREAAPWAETLGVPAKVEGMLRDAGLRPVRVERREYRFEMPRETYVEGCELGMSGRFVRAMLGPSGWERFRERARARFAEGFGERVVDFREVLLGVGTKP